MKVIEEENWSHVLFESNDDWILTVLISSGPATYDRCIKLTDSEKNKIKSTKSYLNIMIGDIRNGKYSSRYVVPPIWPQHCK